MSQNSSRQLLRVYAICLLMPVVMGNSIQIED